MLLTFCSVPKRELNCDNICNDIIKDSFYKNKKVLYVKVDNKYCLCNK